MEQAEGMEARELTLGRAWDPEAGLIQDAKAFRPEAWREIYLRYYPKIYTYLYVRFNDKASAEDLASQVFLEAIRGIRTFTYYGIPLSSWLYRIAHNISVDFLRRRQRLKLEPLNEAVQTAATAANQLETVDFRTALMAALQCLTPEQQQVIVLRFVEGMPVASTAVAMGRSRGAVKALQRRALASLRRHLNQNERA
ncbi:MAG: RNA polymerase sigma factor [Dehalococcoidia bacterium]